LRSPTAAGDTTPRGYEGTRDGGFRAERTAFSASTEARRPPAGKDGRMKRILLPVVALTLSLSAVSTAGAATGTFGADLTHLPPNNTPGDVCSAGIPSYGLPAGSQSCMFTYFGSGADTLFAPVGFQ